MKGLFVELESSNVSGVRFEEDDTGVTAGIMQVKFKNGGVYEYLDVPADLYEALLAENEDEDGSVGRFFGSNIRGGGFECRKVPAEELD